MFSRCGESELLYELVGNLFASVAVEYGSVLVVHSHKPAFVLDDFVETGGNLLIHGAHGGTFSVAVFVPV